jgi:hypothetical membrane protein
MLATIGLNLLMFAAGLGVYRLGVRFYGKSAARFIMLMMALGICAIGVGIFLARVDLPVFVDQSIFLSIDVKFTIASFAAGITFGLVHHRDFEKLE